MRIVKHKQDSGHVLFRYPYFEGLSDCDERIICLSERSMSIILNALEYSDKMRTRVYSSAVGELYTTVDDTEWSNFQYWVSTVRTELGSYIMCNEKLERIAVALESMVQAADEQTVNLADVFEALGITPSESEADILEALDYIINFPGLPSAPKLPLGEWMASFMESRYRSAHLQLLRDISISQRGQAVAQGGVDFAGLYDTMGESVDSLMVKAGYVGKAYWLWRWIDNDQIPGWLGWLTTISGAILGSIRNAIYDLVETVEELDLQGIEDAIKDQTLQVTVNCNSATMGDVCNHLQPPGQPVYVTVDSDSSWDGTSGTPPTSDDTTWNEPPTGEGDYKCKASNYIVDWLQAFYGHSEWNLSPNENLITLSDKFAYILSLIPPIGPGLTGLSSVIGLTLAYISGGSTDIFETINEKIGDRVDDLRCALYNATDATSARTAFKDIMIEEELNSIALNQLDVFLTMNNIMGLLFFEPEVIAAELAFKEDGNCDCGAPLFFIYDGLCTPTVNFGNFAEDEDTEVESCLGLPFGTTREVINLNSGPGGAAGPNRRVRITSVTGGGDFHVIKVVDGVPDSGTVYGSAAALAGFDEEINALQITKHTEPWNVSFTCIFVVNEL